MNCTASLYQTALRPDTSPYTSRKIPPPQDVCLSACLPACLSVCLSSLMSRVITSTLNQTVTYWLQGGMSCHCSLAKCCAGLSLNVTQERLADCDGHQNVVSFLQLLFLSRFASSLIFFIPKGNGRRNFLL